MARKHLTNLEKLYNNNALAYFAGEKSSKILPLHVNDVKLYFFVNIAVAK